MLMEEMREGKWLYWKTKKIPVDIPDISRAFHDPKLRAKAVTPFTTEGLTSAIDEEDAQDSDEEDRCDLDDIVHEPEYVDNQDHEQYSDEPPVSVALDGGPTQTLPKHSNLVIPPALAVVDFGLLTLVDFANQSVCLCLRCRCVVNSAHHRILKKHYNACNALPSTSESPISSPVSTSSLPVVDEDVNMPTVDVDDQPLDDAPSSAEEDEDILVKAKPGTDKRWKQVRLYLDTLRPPIQTLETGVPTKVIPQITILPVVKALCCPVSGCPHAFSTEDTLCSHIKKKHPGHTPRDTDSYGPQQCDAQTLGLKGSLSSLFRVDLVDSPEVTLSVADHMRAALFHRPGKSVPQAQLPGPQHERAFFRKFPYPSVFPTACPDRALFVQKCLAPISAVYRGDNHLEGQLLVIAVIVYYLQGRTMLRQAPDLVRKHIANKSLSNQLFLSQVQPTFTPLATATSIMKYSRTLSALVYYVMRCAEDPRIDPNLQLHAEHVSAATALLTTLRRQIQPDLEHTLRDVKHIAPDQNFSDAPELFRSSAFRPLIPNCLALQHDIHTLIISLTRHPASLPASTPIMSTPLTRFLALQSWNPKDNSFCSTDDIGGWIAHLQYSMRLAVLVEWRNKMQDTDTLAPLRHLHDELLYRDSLSPFALISEQRSYATALGRMTTGAPNTSWSDDKGTLYIDQIAVPIHELRDSLRNTFNNAKELLYTNILFGESSKIFGGDGAYKRPQKLMVDQPKITTAGYSYFQPNLFFQNNANALSEVIINHPRLRSQFVRPYIAEADIQWNHSAIHTWLQEVDQYVAYLAILFYFLPGMPPRSTELLSLRINNGETMPRNILAIQDEVVISQGYTKSEASTGMPLMVARFLPAELVELYEVYVSVVRPLQNRFRTIIEPPDISIPFSTFESLLFTSEGHPMESKKFSTILQAFSAQFLRLDGRTFALRRWRQSLTASGNAHIPFEVRETKIVMPTTIAIQASHRQNAADQHYDTQIETTLSHITSANFQKFRTFSHHWHALWGFRAQIALQILTSAGFQQCGDIREIITQTIQTTVASMHLTRQGISDLVVQSIVARQEQVDSSPVICQPLNTLVQTVTLDHLYKLYKVNSFRTPEQGQAVQYVLTRSPTPLLVIHPTGSGKSVLFHLPAMCERPLNMFTVVIVPNLSLAHAICISAQKLDLRCEFINPGGQKPHRSNTLVSSDLVVMTYDMLICNQSVIEWLRSAASTGILARIVVDEVHTLITDVHYRTGFRGLYATLLQFAVSYVFLTGTLPPSQLPELLRDMNFHTSIVCTRLPSDRPNLSYNVNTVRVTRDNLPQIAEEIRSKTMALFDSDNHARMLVYTRTVANACTMAELLSCPVYHANLDTKIKEQTLRAWLNPDNTDPRERIVVGTSSLSVGIDCPNARAIFFVEDPYTLVDFAQQAARGGRDGLPATIMVYACKTTPAGTDEAWRSFLNTTDCRRTPMSDWLDGRSITCSALPSPQMCDNCAPSTVSVETSSSPSWQLNVPALRLHNQRTDLATTVQELYRAIDHLRAECCYCILGRRVIEHTHTHEECPYRPNIDITLFGSVLSQIRDAQPVDWKIACTFCHLPQQSEVYGVMDEHLKHLPSDGTPCLLHKDILHIYLALLECPSQQYTLQRMVPEGSVHLLLPKLFSLRDTYPCSASEPSQQIFNIHLLILSAVASTLNPSNGIVTYAARDWMKDLVRVAHVDDNILPFIPMRPSDYPKPTNGSRRRLSPTRLNRFDALSNSNPDTQVRTDDVTHPLYPPTAPRIPTYTHRSENRVDNSQSARGVIDRPSFAVPAYVHHTNQPAHSNRKRTRSPPDDDPPPTRSVIPALLQNPFRSKYD